MSIQKPDISYYYQYGDWGEIFTNGLPILMYHKLGYAPLGTRYRFLALPQRIFENQLRELKKAGYKTINLDQINDYNPGDKKFIITFDDAYESVYTLGLPILNKYGFKATTYLVSDAIGGKNDWDLKNNVDVKKTMTQDQILQWLRDGHRIGSHTLSHPHLTKISAQKAKIEIFKSKEFLEDLFNLPVDHFCYPFGDYNKAIRDMVQEAGYKTATTIHFGVNQKIIDPFTLKRLTARTPPFKLRIWLRRVFKGREAH